MPDSASLQDSPLTSVFTEAGGCLSGPPLLSQSWQVTYQWLRRWFIEQVGLSAHCLTGPVDLCLAEFYLHFVSLGECLGVSIAKAKHHDQNQSGDERVYFI